MIPAASTLRKGGDWVPSDGLDAKHAGQLERPTHKTSFRAATPSPAGDRLLLRLCCPAHPREGVRGVGRRGKAPGGPGSAGAASSDLRADLFVPATLPAPLRPPVIPWSSCLLHLSALGPFTRGAAPAPVPPPETDADAGASPRALPECGAARNKRIVGVLHRFIERQTASAYVSTLGGGYFLCDYLGHAQRAALVQLRIAATSGDEKAVGRCLVHLAYSQIKVRGTPGTPRALPTDPAPTAHYSCNATNAPSAPSAWRPPWLFGTKIGRWGPWSPRRGAQFGTSAPMAPSRMQARPTTTLYASVPTHLQGKPRDRHSTLLPPARTAVCPWWSGDPFAATHLQLTRYCAVKGAS